MAIDLLTRNKSVILISVGEEGAVIVYVVNDQIVQKFFTKSTDSHDTIRLVQLLNQDKNAKIHILLDTIDQTYVQKVVPGVSAFSIDGIAKSRIEREVPAEYLKCVVQLYKNPGARREWMYTFVSAPYEQPVSKWVEFFAPFPNIIDGIHFLPIEMTSIVPMLRDEKRQVKRRFEFVYKLLPDRFNKQPKHGWEIIFTQNKTGGFRQVALLDTKIVFSRLINNINNPDPDVLAGNIEEEINNSIEFTSRLGLGSEDNITVYFVLSNDALRSLRLERIKAKKIKMFSPYTFARKIGAVDAATERDKFCDPSVLYSIARQDSFIAQIHVKASEKVYLIAKYVEYMRKFFFYTTPIVLAILCFFIFYIAKNQLEIASLRDKIRTINTDIEQKKLELENVKNKIVDRLLPEEVSAIVQMDKFFSYSNETPISLLLDLSSALPDYARVKKLNWFYNDPEMMSFKLQKGAKFTDPQADRPYAVEVVFDLLFVEPGSTYEELAEKYDKVTQALKTRFPQYSVHISELPRNINFANLGNKIEVNVNIVYGIKLDGLRLQYVTKRN